MSVDKSDRYSLPLLLSGQAQKEITHNEALILVDMLIHAQVESASISTPPGSAAPGDCWIVGTGGTAEWDGYDGDIAGMTSSGWRFVSPRAGFRAVVSDIGKLYVHDGSVWAEDSAQQDGFYVTGQRIIGPRQPAVADPSGGTTVDTEARTAIAQILSGMRSHGMIEP